LSGNFGDCQILSKYGFNPFHLQTLLGDDIRGEQKFQPSLVAFLEPIWSQDSAYPKYQKKMFANMGWGTMIYVHN
jgi:hypothetical protein